MPSLFSCKHYLAIVQCWLFCSTLLFHKVWLSWQLCSACRGSIRLCKLSILCNTVCLFTLYKYRCAHRETIYINYDQSATIDWMKSVFALNVLDLITQIDPLLVTLGSVPITKWHNRFHLRQVRVVSCCKRRHVWPFQMRSLTLARLAFPFGTIISATTAICGHSHRLLAKWQLSLRTLIG